MSSCFLIFFCNLWWLSNTFKHKRLRLSLVSQLSKIFSKQSFGACGFSCYLNLCLLCYFIKKEALTSPCQAASSSTAGGAHPELLHLDKVKKIQQAAFLREKFPQKCVNLTFCDKMQVFRKNYPFLEMRCFPKMGKWGISPKTMLYKEKKINYIYG